MAQKKVAVVTGSNKGIGFAIVKGLCKHFDGVVYLTSRDAKRGANAIKAMSELGLHPEYHQLDIVDEASVNNFAEYLKSKYGGLDLLVNNAAIAFPNAATEPVSYQAENTLKVNYFGTLRVCNALFPLLRNNARVVNVSSSAGHFSRIPSTDLRKKFLNDNLQISELNELMQNFIDETKAGTHVANGWGNSTYVVSKVGVGALTRIQQRQFDQETDSRNICVNAVHPGYVDTDMTNHKGILTPEEGAKAPLYLALEAQGLKGQFVWNDNRVFSWDANEVPPRERNN